MLLSLLLSMALAQGPVENTGLTPEQVKICKKAKRRLFWRNQASDFFAVLINTEVSNTSFTVTTDNGQNVSGNISTTDQTDWQSAERIAKYDRAMNDEKYLADITVDGRVLNCQAMTTGGPR